MRALFLLLLLSCSSQQAATPAPAADPRERCCAQCRAASGRDPSGTDISVKLCSSYPAEYNGGPGVDDDCRAWFRTHRLMLRDCQTP